MICKFCNFVPCDFVQFTKRTILLSSTFIKFAIAWGWRDFIVALITAVYGEHDEVSAYWGFFGVIAVAVAVSFSFSDSFHILCMCCIPIADGLTQCVCSIFHFVFALHFNVTLYPLYSFHASK